MPITEVRRNWLRVYHAALELIKQNSPLISRKMARYMARTRADMACKGQRRKLRQAAA